ncbi:SDR family oxidoreductase [Nocardioides marinquilinus]|uniref:SDR family oxidoreductase n=1 Tax=Nocardioides marinquilinus TaxID=1210400 RepID=A0ABP9P8Q8_9ACTN
MRLLVLGGTAFLSRATAAEAVRRGHDVVCACRGETGTVPDGATLVRWDRAAHAEPPDGLRGERFDAVVDVARHPSWVRHAVAAFPGAHWVFVSTVNVYDDESTPGLRPDTSTLVDAVHTDEDLATGPEQYGPMKVGCEEAVTAGAASSVLVRPGLIVGPGDPTSRYGYWPERLAEGGEALAGGEPGDSTQVIDVRDLAAWLVLLAERRTPGAFDGVGPTTTTGRLLDETAAGVGSTAALTWVPGAFLTEQGVEPWMGDSALPMWLPRPEYDGMTARDASPSLDAGLVVRPVAETARDTLAWLRERPEVRRTGLSREHEQQVLAAWHGRSG